MTDKHNQSFFGQSTGMFIQSSSKNDPFMFLQFIKKKEDGTWEKLSMKEGKTIKCSLEEIIMILRVLTGKIKSWSTVHSFKEEKTPISVSWESETKLWFNVGEYPKMLSFAQIEILRMLLEHLLEEKIEFATVGILKNSCNNKQSSNTILESNIPKGLHLEISEEINLGDNVKKVLGVIKGETEKALLINLGNGDESWIPKSVIKSNYNIQNEAEQSFLVDTWFLEKNKIIV
ncbi:MAG: hypothetical protein ACFFA0_05090 [Promethearchaeota archaeon]